MSEPDLKLDGGVLRRETLVEAPPPWVLDYVANLQNMEHLWPEHKLYRRLCGDGGPGTRYLWLFASMGAVLLGITRIEVREPGRLAYRTAMLGLPIRMSYEFSPTAG